MVLRTRSQRWKAVQDMAVSTAAVVAIVGFSTSCFHGPTLPGRSCSRCSGADGTATYGCALTAAEWPFVSYALALARFCLDQRSFARRDAARPRRDDALGTHGRGLGAASPSCAAAGTWLRGPAIRSRASVKRLISASMWRGFLRLSSLFSVSHFCRRGLDGFQDANKKGRASLSGWRLVGVFVAQRWTRRVRGAIRRQYSDRTGLVMRTLSAAHGATVAGLIQRARGVS